MDDENPIASGESTFSMDPQVVLLELSRSLVQGQRTLGNLRRLASEAAAAGPAAQDVAATFEDYQKLWHDDTLPMLLASMQLAIEVVDTFGPGVARVADPTEAAIWNNKHTVWFNELAGRSDGR